MSRLPLLLLLVAGTAGAASEDWVFAVGGPDFEIHFRKGSGTIASVGGERIASALARLTRDGRIDERILSISEHDCRAGTGLLVVEPPRLEVRYLSGGGTHGSAVGDLLCLAFDL